MQRTALLITQTSKTTNTTARSLTPHWLTYRNGRRPWVNGTYPGGKNLRPGTAGFIYNRDFFLRKMKTKKIKILIKVLLLFVVFGIFILTYVPFCKLKDIYDDNWLPEYTNTEKEDQLIYRIIGNSVIFCERLSLYCRCLFITKGKTFDDIRCSDKNGRLHNISLEFNWDNSINLYDSNHSYKLNVDSISIANSAYVDTEALEDFDKLSEENHIICIDFYDNNNNRIGISRQHHSLPYGKQRYAFDFSINGTEMWTGKETGFDY